MPDRKFTGPDDGHDAAPDHHRCASHRLLACTTRTGGALYTIGALSYATTWPNPFPATFGFHEVFHVLVIAAAATQFVAVSLVVL